MFSYGEVWVHDCTDDIALDVLFTEHLGPICIKVKAHLINRHNGLYYETDTYVIDCKELCRWRRIK